MEKSIENTQDTTIEDKIDSVVETIEVNEGVQKPELEYTSKEFQLIEFIKAEMNLPQTDVRTYSPLTLAFIGDVVYDLVIRTMVVEQGNAPVNKLHKRVSNLVKAPAQMELFRSIEPILTEEEMLIFKRGRNAKSFTSAKNASITDYRIATGFEALLGYLYLDNRFARVVQIIKYGLDQEKK